MPGSTKDIISRALTDLMASKPADKITVRDVVERCGVNRNTFYYHFRDIEDVAEYTMREQVNQLMSVVHQSDSAMDMLMIIADFLEKNRKFILHIYKSMRRELFIRYLRDIAAYTVGTVSSSPSGISDPFLSDHPILGSGEDLFFFKCFMEGILLDWVDSGMPYNLRDRLEACQFPFSEQKEVPG